MLILRIIAALFSLAVCFTPLAAQAQTRGEMAAPAGHRIVLPADVTPDHYDIAITPNAQQLTFTGTVRVAITVHTATDKIVLNDADIVIDRASLAGAAAAANVTYDAKAETVGLVLDHPLQPGRYSLMLDYHGVIYKQASGLFALDYQSGGKPGRALFTQFENSDARRFVPCWTSLGARRASP
jgi:aminopeptidase N